MTSHTNDVKQDHVDYRVGQPGLIEMSDQFLVKHRIALSGVQESLLHYKVWP